MKILVVDDSVSMRQMLTIILSGAHHQVIDAADGTDALPKLSDDLDLIITDYNMPQMGGIEFIRRVRAGSVARVTPIIILTTESETSKKMEGRDAGATAWITKPFTRDALLTTIEKVTRNVEF